MNTTTAPAHETDDLPAALERIEAQSNDRWKACLCLHATWQEQVDSVCGTVEELYCLAGEYSRASPMVRAIVDRVIVAICGYSLATIIRVAAGEDIDAAVERSPDAAYPLDNFPGSADVAAVDFPGLRARFIATLGRDR